MRCRIRLQSLSMPFLAFESSAVCCPRPSNLPSTLLYGSFGAKLQTRAAACLRVSRGPCGAMSCAKNQPPRDHHLKSIFQLRPNQKDEVLIMLRKIFPAHLVFFFFGLEDHDGRRGQRLWQSRARRNRSARPENEFVP